MSVSQSQIFSLLQYLLYIVCARRVTRNNEIFKIEQPVGTSLVKDSGVYLLCIVMLSFEDKSFTKLSSKYFNNF